MPYSHSLYVRKTTRGDWQEENMDKAIASVLANEMSIREASEYHAVPKSTLGRRVLDKNKVAKGAAKHLGRFQTTFDREFEEELVQYAKDMERRFFGISYLDLRRLAFQLAGKNALPHQFNKEKQLAGKKWARLFMKRHPCLSLRQPEATSYARAVGFNRPAVAKFFALLTETVDKYQLDGSRIYNCDESGMKTVQQQHSKVIAVKGKKQVGSMTSSERGKNVTVVCCANAYGHFIPPMFVFAHKRMNPVFMDHSPTSSVGYAQENGWMTMELFKSYLEHFAKMVKPSSERPVCLILDGHSSHTRSLDALDYAKSNGIIMLSLPSHTTHKLQPLDVGFFKPLQTYYDRFISTWLRSHPGRTFTEYQVAEAFSDAFGKAATVATAVNSFAKCGIWPVNPYVFTDADYSAAETTDRPLAVGGTAPAGVIVADPSGPGPVEQKPRVSLPADANAAVVTAGDLPGPSTSTNDIAPRPQASQRVKRGRKKKSESASGAVSTANNPAAHDLVEQASNHQLDQASVLAEVTEAVALDLPAPQISSSLGRLQFMH